MYIPNNFCAANNLLDYVDTLPIEEIYVGEYNNMCRAVRPKHGFYCTRTPGHSGPHVGATSGSLWSNGKRYSDDAVWMD